MVNPVNRSVNVQRRGKNLELGRVLEAGKLQRKSSGPVPISLVDYKLLRLGRV